MRQSRDLCRACPEMGRVRLALKRGPPHLQLSWCPKLRLFSGGFLELTSHCVTAFRCRDGVPKCSSTGVANPPVGWRRYAARRTLAGSVATSSCASRRPRRGRRWPRRVRRLVRGGSLLGGHGTFARTPVGSRRIGKQAAACPWHHRLVAHDREQQGHDTVSCASSRLARVAGSRVASFMLGRTLRWFLATAQPGAFRFLG